MYICNQLVEKHQEYRICNRCIMDTTDPVIRFDDQGNCNHCTEFLETRSRYSYQGEQSDVALASLIHEIKRKGKGRPYDCIVGLSGGVDSSYTAWKAKELGLRVLAVHLDNGWNSIEANQNIRSIANKLAIDYETEVLDWEEFKQIQRAFLKASVPEADTPTDIAILAVLHKAAAKHGIQYILSGGNFATEGILPKHWHYNAKDLRYFRHICRQFGPVSFRSFPTFGLIKEAYYKLFRGIKMVYFLNYFPFDKAKSIELLKTELDWKDYGGKHYESKYTGFIQSYYLLNKFNIDYRRATLSSQICAGSIKREEALDTIKQIPYRAETLEHEKNYIAKKLGFSMDEFDEILNRSGKWYYTYPNNDSRLQFFYNLYRRLFNKEKLSSF